MTVGDARKTQAEKCPGIVHCPKIGDLFDHEFFCDKDLQDAIVETCRQCEKEQAK